jgi:Tol biopolymer transport system component
VDSSGGPTDNGSFNPAISGDGRRVVYWSFADDIVAGDDNESGDVFLRDIRAGTNILISRSRTGGFGDGESDDPAISVDGALVVWQSFASDLVSGDTNEAVDVFLRDVAAETTKLITRARDGGPADGPSFVPVFSEDASHIVFESVAGNLVADDPNEVTDVFRYRLA